jgi:hypothetical protein
MEVSDQFRRTYNGAMGNVPLILPILLAANEETGVGEGVESAVVQVPPWPPAVTLLLLIVAAIFVVTIYLRERGRAHVLAKLALATVRFALIALVIFMLYGWMQQRYRTDLPDLVVIVDDSASMSLEDYYDDQKLQAALAKRIQAAGLDKATRLNLAKSLLIANDGDLLKSLQEKYNLKFYVVGGAARAESSEGGALVDVIRKLDAEQPASRLGKGLRDVLEAQRGRPTAAVIVLTDGITTEGKSIGETAEYARRKAIPLFLVGLGNDKSPRDLRLSDLLVDEIVFVNDMVNFDVKLTGSGLPAKTATVRLMRAGDSRVLAEKSVTIAREGEPQPVRISYRPDKIGDFEYVVEVEPLQGEANVENNRQSRLVSVREETIRVLLVQAYPNYEFRYLKTLLGRELKSSQASAGTAPAGKAIELTTVLQEADLEYAELDETAQRVFPVSRDELFKYDVLIFGDVNPSFLSLSVMNNIADFVKERGGGVIFIAGPRYTPLAYRDTPLAELLPVNLVTVSAPPPDAILKDAFTPRLTRLGLGSPPLQLGDTPADTLRIWQKLPGLYWFLEAPDVRPAARVLAEHPTRTGNDGQGLPLICLQYVGAGKVVFHATDETWRWRFRIGDLYFARYWIQTIRYLSRSKLLGQSRAAEVTSDREQYRRGDSVQLRVRFFDDRLAPPQDDGVTVMLEHEGSKRRQIKLTRDALDRGIFDGAVDNLAEGQYRAWVATPTLEGKPPARRFSVISPPGEQARLEMDAADLKLAAKTSQGHFYTMQNVDRLTADLPRGRQVRIEALPPEPIWNWWPLALSFIGLIVTEWLLRKRMGML